MPFAARQDGRLRRQIGVVLQENVLLFETTLMLVKVATRRGNVQLNAVPPRGCTSRAAAILYGRVLHAKPARLDWWPITGSQITGNGVVGCFDQHRVRH